MNLELGIKIAGKELIIPDSIVNLWIIVLLLTVFALIVNKKIKKSKDNEAPSSFLNVIELLVESVDGLVESTMGSHNMRFSPYIFTLIVFLVVANLFGLTGLTPPTSDYSVTLALALITFALTQYWAWKNGGGLIGYIKGYGEPMPLLAPLNVIGELSNPISLSFRLFGNIMSGGIIMGLVYGAAGYVAPFIAAPLHIYFDLFAGALQAFIFIMLSMIFIGGAEEA